MPFVSVIEWRLSGPVVGAPGQNGVRAAISHWWFRNEPPKADWKNASEIA